MLLIYILVDWSAQNNQIEATKFLISNYDVDMLIKNIYGRSILTEAFKSGNSELIDLCLSHPSASEENLLRTDPSTDENTTKNPEANAVTHILKLKSSDVTINIRELPITRADNPFGGANDPENDSTGIAYILYLCTYYNQLYVCMICIYAYIYLYIFNIRFMSLACCSIAITMGNHYVCVTTSTM